MKNDNIWHNKTNYFLLFCIISVIISGSIFKQNASADQYHPLKRLTIARKLSEQADNCKSMLFIYKSNDYNEFTSCNSFMEDIQNYIEKELYILNPQTLIVGLDYSQLIEYNNHIQIINKIYYKLKDHESR